VFQVGCILIGHLLGVLAAHERALRAAPEKPSMLIAADELPSVMLILPTASYICCTATDFAHRRSGSVGQLGIPRAGELGIPFVGDSFPGQRS
jgi:hypothetical protein